MEKGAEHKKKLGCFPITLIVLVGLSIFGIAISQLAKYGSNNVSPTPTPDMAVVKKDVSERFCKARKGEYSYGVFICSGCIDLNDAYKFLSSGEITTLHNAKSSPKAKICDKVAESCLNVWDIDSCQKIADRNIWIGMSEDQLLMSWGIPKDKNNTVGSWGIHSQWVYADFGPYVYLEGKDEHSLKVTSWQD